MAVVEFLIYFAIVAFVLSFSLSGLLSMGSSVSKLRAARYRDAAVVQGFDAIERRVRDASYVVVASSTLDANPGVLALDTKSQIYLSGAALMERIYPSLVGATVTPNVISISKYIVRRIPTDVSDGVRIEMTVDGVDYETTVATRGR